MLTNDIFINPIISAFEKVISEFENVEDDCERFIYELFRRSKAIWEHIMICGLNVCGMTYEEFCKQLEEKRHIVFMDDDAFNKYEKAIEIMRILEEGRKYED